MTDFRALCTELWDELQYQTDWSVAEELKERARAALAQPEPEGRTDEDLMEIRDAAYCPGADEVNDEEDSLWQYTSNYIQWLDEHGSIQEQQEYEAKGLRAVFDAGSRWGNHRGILGSSPQPPLG